MVVSRIVSGFATSLGSVQSMALCLLTGRGRCSGCREDFWCKFGWFKFGPNEMNSADVRHVHPRWCVLGGLWKSGGASFLDSWQDKLVLANFPETFGPRIAVQGFGDANMPINDFLCESCFWAGSYCPCTSSNFRLKGGSSNMPWVVMAPVHSDHHGPKLNRTPSPNRSPIHWSDSKKILRKPIRICSRQNARRSFDNSLDLTPSLSSFYPPLPWPLEDGNQRQHCVLFQKPPNTSEEQMYEVDCYMITYNQIPTIDV